MRALATGWGWHLGSWLAGPTDPAVAWSDTEVILTANGGDFAGGRVVLAAHYLALSIPDAV